MQYPVLQPRPNPDIFGFGVFDGIGQRFLHNAIKRGLDGARQSPGKLCFNVDGQIRALGDSLSEKTDGGNPPQIVEDRRAKLMRIPAQMFFNLVEQPFDFPDLFLPARRQLQRQICQSEMDGDQQLAGLIVDRVSDALYHFLECFVELSEGLNGRSEEHTSELQSRLHLVCRLLLEKKKKNDKVQ